MTNASTPDEARPERRRLAVPTRELLARARSLPRIDAKRFGEDVDEVLDQSTG